MTNILILVSILIVLFFFIGATMIFNKNKNAEVKEHKKIEEKTNQQQIEHSVKYFIDQTTEMFTRYFVDYVDEVESNNISDLNKKYKKEIAEILSSAEVKTIIANGVEDQIVKIERLKIISEETPFTWAKKFKKEMEEFNG